MIRSKKKKKSQIPKENIVQVGAMHSTNSKCILEMDLFTLFTGTIQLALYLKHTSLSSFHDVFSYRSDPIFRTYKRNHVIFMLFLFRLG